MSVKSNPNARLNNNNRRLVNVTNSISNNQSTRQIGIPGATGETGNQGEQGEQGIRGVQGLVGLNWTGDYLTTRTYQKRDAVQFTGSSYVYINNNISTNISPPDALYWGLIAQGGNGNDKQYIHVQNSASTTWTITHNLNAFPSVTVVDSANTEVIGEIIYIDVNNISIMFSSPFGGRAYLN